MNYGGAPIAGWYGKIPAIGDFTSRRLPRHFIDLWDNWLQRSIVASRKQLKENWLDSYLTGPIWHFVLMPGICENKIWTGILMPSVDNVGRYFPLTIALEIEPNTNSMLAAFSAQTWHADIETLALSSLDINIFPNNLDQGLNRLVFPYQNTKIESTRINKLAAWWQLESSDAKLNDHKALSLPAENTITEQMNLTAAELLFTYGSNKSVWWRITSETAIAQTNCYTGLPPENIFSTFLNNYSSPENF